MQQTQKAALLLLGLSVVLGTCAGHGYIHKSRSHLCKAEEGNLNKDCGQAQYEPQSLEYSKGFPAAGPADGQIAAANRPEFAELNQFGAKRWTPVPISQFVTKQSGKKLVLDFPWTLTASHKTTSFEYFISKKNYNPDAPLTRAQLELKPFCADMTQLGVMPPKEYVSHNCELDSDGYKGVHVILGVWTIDDTANAFYQVVDVQFSD